ncbi:MET7A protein, partial [Fregetta grallaria]|nr:MET7A protein [Fregetta grallaria]
CVQLLLLPIHVLACLGLWGSFYKKVFPYVVAKVAPTYNRKVCKQKQELFGNLRKFAGPSGQLMLLEIGTGTGPNFQFYPPGCRLTRTDPNPNFRKFLLKSPSENRHLKLERLVVASGEDLHQIPDGTVDVAVCTLVLCSVANVKKVLAEVLRVLRVVSWGSARETGDADLVEWVAADHSSWTYFWQKVCDPIWKYFGDGCSLTRETQKELEKTDFSELNLRCIHVTPYWIPTSPHIIGYAVK